MPCVGSKGATGACSSRPNSFILMQFWEVLDPPLMPITLPEDAILQLATATSQQRTLI